MVYTTEDGRNVVTGERAFNYYDRQAGIIGADAGDGWFDFVQDDGRTTLLNGARICTITLAQAKGWADCNGRTIG